jgi:hypothetical protein
LLKSPFRYGNPTGSRFRKPAQRDGCFYAAEHVETAIREMSFYRAILFFADSPDTVLPTRPTEHTAISVPVKTDMALDLTAEPLSRDQGQWESLMDYGACQDLADQARLANIAAIRYQSMRDGRGRCNVVLLVPNAFGTKLPKRQQTWKLFLRLDSVQVWCESTSTNFEIALASFATDPRVAEFLKRRTTA